MARNSSLNSKKLVVIAGPTAVGKTALSVKLAQHYRAEIISADSRQIFKELSIGTAKPTAEEQQGIKHHFIGSHSISETFSAGEFEEEALKIAAQLFQENDTVVVAGGSGLYVRAFCEGMDEMPDVPEAIRQNLNQLVAEKGLEPLLKQLQELDPDFYSQIDKANPQRVIRALEVCLASGKPYSFFRNQQPKARPFKIVKIGLNRDREELYRRIGQRMDLMLEQGLLEEVKSVLPFRNHQALATVGYQEIFGFLDGQYDWEETVRLLKRNSRRYAKRQLTWFRKDTDFKWFGPHELKEIIRFIDEA